MGPRLEGRGNALVPDPFAGGFDDASMGPRLEGRGNTRGFAWSWPSTRCFNGAAS